MPAPGEFADRGAQGVALTGGIEPAFGRALLPPFGNDAGGVRPKLAGDADHLRRRRHFEIERLFDAFLEPQHVVIDDVAAILAQMRGDAVGAGRDRDLGRLDGIGMAPAARVAHGRDMIDIDAEADETERACLPVHPLGVGDHFLRPQLRDDRGEVLEVIDFEIDGQFGEVRRLPRSCGYCRYCRRARRSPGRSAPATPAR